MNSMDRKITIFGLILVMAYIVISGIYTDSLQAENIKLKQELKIAKTITYIQESPKVENKQEKELIDYAIAKASKKYKVDKDLIYSIIKHESNFNPTAVSSAGCVGLMQISPNRSKNPFSILDNIDTGTKHLAGMIARYNGDIEKGVMSYNCGGGRLDSGDIPKQTIIYKDKVLKSYKELK